MGMQVFFYFFGDFSLFVRGETIWEFATWEAKEDRSPGITSYPGSPPRWPRRINSSTGFLQATVGPGATV